MKARWNSANSAGARLNRADVGRPPILVMNCPVVSAIGVGAFCFHQGAIWGGLISPLLILYATTHQIGLSGPILVTTVVGLAIFLVAVLLSPETKGKVLVADLTVA